MVQVQPRYSVYYCIKIFFKSWFVWLIWPFECLILMIFTTTKFHENLLRVSALSLLFISKFFSSLETKTLVEIPNETFLRNTQNKGGYIRISKIVPFVDDFYTKKGKRQNISSCHWIDHIIGNITSSLSFWATVLLHPKDIDANNIDENINTL